MQYKQLLMYRLIKGQTHVYRIVVLYQQFKMFASERDCLNSS